MIYFPSQIHAAHIHWEVQSSVMLLLWRKQRALQEKNAHGSPSLPSDHSELDVGVRRKKATSSEYQKIPKDPEGSAEQWSKPKVPPLVFLVFSFFFTSFSFSLLFFFSYVFSHFKIHNILDVSFSFRSTSTCSLHNCFLFQKTCSSISFFFISWSTMDSTMRLLLVLFDFSFPLSLPRDIQQIVS